MRKKIVASSKQLEKNYSYKDLPRKKKKWLKNKLNKLSDKLKLNLGNQFFGASNL